MPELPEVETTCRILKPFIRGQVINQIIVRQLKLRWPIPDALYQLKRAQILGISRRAKYILIQTSKGTLIIHLGMSGCLRAIDIPTPPKKHDHVDFLLQNGSLLRFTDPRRFGAILWTKIEPLKYPILAKLGVEPLLTDFNQKYLFNYAQNKKNQIKQLIMDQKVVVGVGNIYANEALFMAKISPTRISFSLSAQECSTLVRCIKTVLKKAIIQGGTTFKDFLTPEGKPGYFKQQLLVYGREGKECLLCESPLLGIRINQRATVYCPECQK